MELEGRLGGYRGGEEARVVPKEEAARENVAVIPVSGREVDASTRLTISVNTSPRPELDQCGEPKRKGLQLSRRGSPPAGVIYSLITISIVHSDS